MKNACFDTYFGRQFGNNFKAITGKNTLIAMVNRHDMAISNFT
jgi:hypothetical protein